MLDQTDLKVTGKITYCGHELNEFVPKKTCAYISQSDLHHGLMTVRETLDFSGKCLGVGTLYKLMEELLFDPTNDALMKGVATKSHEASLVTEHLLKILGLDNCADTIVGDNMRRGISGGEKKRLTIGEMLAGPAKVLLMDEISTGLDSSTAFRICKYISEMVHIMDMTVVISLLQPSPELFELFDDVILLSDGQIVYQGPRHHVLDFFEYVGFKCPKRKGVADFLQEVTSKKDQQQYWFKDQTYKYIPVSEFVEAFQSFHVGQELSSSLKIPYQRSNAHPLALVKEKHAISNKELIKACFLREWLLMKRNIILYIFKNVQVMIMSLATMSAFFRTKMHHETVADGEKYIGAIFFSLTNIVLNGMAECTLTILGLPVFYKQRDLLFYPAWAYGLPVWILSIPASFIESGLWTILTYYTIGYAPAPTRFFCQWLGFFCIHQMAMSIFRFLSALGRTLVIANTIGTIVLIFAFVLSGFIIAKGDVGQWIIWAYYLSPMMYGQQVLISNEFLDNRWSNPNTDPRINGTTIGNVILASRGLSNHQYWFWISIGALLGFTLINNILYILSLTFLNPFSGSKALAKDADKRQKKNDEELQSTNFVVSSHSSRCTNPTIETATKGMYLPFQHLSLTFNHINYYVDGPTEMKGRGYDNEGYRLQLLQDVSGAFRPGVLTALLGITGAGKTTLLDVLAGKKTSGYIEGSITVSGYPKNQETFARICGYCEQNAIHSPCLTVYESLVFSTWLRLSSNIDLNTRKMFIEEVMRLVELQPLKDAIVGLPRISGLSTEQRKRLTIAVELVANPSIVFMDEPTSGLDARAAAIVMRTMRNVVNNGRTVVCTIHQPSIDIFEAFDELLLMKRGGRLIYAGPLGDHSSKLIEYFEGIYGVPKIKDGYNPATWMLDITSPQSESQMGLDFADIYLNSHLYQYVIY
uniref:ABC transporter domain-containing protein n=1 Tax=Chenopodium quinoa TaxID=63459 RepID=A0A803M6Z8_CHEQI